MMEPLVNWPGLHSLVNCVIPARMGSKRLPGKVLAKVNGIPLLAYAVETARLSGVFAGVWVSTESPEIAEVAERWGAAVIDRPPDLASDTARLKQVIAHAVGAMDSWSAAGPKPYVAVVLPTALLLHPDDLKGMWGKLQVGGKGVMAVVRPAEHPLYSLVEKDGCLVPYTGDFDPPRTQDLPELWVDAGYAYIYDKADFLAHGFYGEHLLGYPLPRYRVVDIDTPEDLGAAEALYERWKKMGFEA